MIFLYGFWNPVCFCKCEALCLLCSCSRSERGIYLYSADALSSGAITNVHIDISPSTLIPFYDPDTSLVILTGKVREKTKNSVNQNTEQNKMVAVCFVSRAIPKFSFMRFWLMSRTFWIAARLALLSHIRY